MKNQDPFKQLQIFPVFEAPKWQKHILRDGRVIWAPNDTIREEHNWMVDELNYSMAMHGVEFEYATATRGSSMVENARRHVGNRFFFKLDFSNAYGQVNLDVLAKLLTDIGVSGTPADLLTWLRQNFSPPEGGGLAQGGPASPLLFNFYCLGLDKEIGDFCRSQGITYTRYLDDLTFSAPDKGFPRRDMINKPKRQEILNIINRYSLALNESKTRVMDLGRGPITITGVQINNQGKLQLRKSHLLKAHTRLHAMQESGVPIEELLSYASGLNGLLNMSVDSTRQMSEAERLLTIDVQDIIMLYGSKLDFKF